MQKKKATKKKVATKNETVKGSRKLISEKEEKKLNAEEYRRLVDQIETTLIQLDDLGKSGDELMSAIRYFNGILGRHFPFEICSVIKQQERLEELEGILERMTDMLTTSQLHKK